MIKQKQWQVSPCSTFAARWCSNCWNSPLCYSPQWILIPPPPATCPRATFHDQLKLLLKGTISLHLTSFTSPCTPAQSLMLAWVHMYLHILSWSCSCTLTLALLFAVIWSMVPRLPSRLAFRTLRPSLSSQETQPLWPRVIPRKAKRKALHLGWGNPMHKHRLGGE